MAPRRDRCCQLIDVFAHGYGWMASIFINIFCTKQSVLHYTSNSTHVANDFLGIPQGNVATSDRCCGQICKISCQISQDSTHQKSLKSVNFWPSYSKNKKVDVLGGTHCIQKFCWWQLISRLFVWKRHGVLLQLGLTWTDVDNFGSHFAEKVQLN